MPALADHNQLCVELARDLEDRLPDTPDARLRPRLRGEPREACKLSALVRDALGAVERERLELSNRGATAVLAPPNQSGSRNSSGGRHT